MVWAIQNQRRVQLNVHTGDIYYDYRMGLPSWKLVTLRGIETFNTKKDALEWKRVLDTIASCEKRLNKLLGIRND